MSETLEKAEERVILDLDYCVECRSCSAACFYGHKGMSHVNYGDAVAGTVPLICRQCDDPACVEACPVEAMERDERGVVKRSLFRCQGCGSCAMACPFGVLDTDLVRHTLPKCDACEDLLAADKKPRCVSACPTGALKFLVPEKSQEEQLLLLGGRLAGRSPYKRR